MKFIILLDFLVLTNRYSEDETPVKWRILFPGGVQYKKTHAQQTTTAD